MPSKQCKDHDFAVSCQVTYSGVEQSTTNAEEHPYVYHQAEAEDQADVQEYTSVRRLCDTVALLTGCRCIAVRGCCVGDLGPTECEEEEQESSCKLSCHSDELVSPFAGEAFLLSLLSRLFLDDVPVGSLPFFMLMVCTLGFLVLLVKGQNILEGHDD